jgi:hypothetical protein
MSGITITGSVTINQGVTIGAGAPAPIVSGSVVFNGSNRLQVPNNTAFSQNSGAWAVECYVYPTNGTQGYIYMQNTSGFLGLVYDGNTFSVDQSGVGFQINSQAGFPINNWYHVAMVYDGSGSISLFVNGGYQGSAGVSGLVGSLATTQIGSYTPGGNSPFRGNVSNLRVTKGVAVYTGNFVVPSAPLATTQGSGTNISAITGTQCQLLLNTVAPNYFDDTSANAFTVTNVNTVTTSTTNPYGSQLTSFVIKLSDIASPSIFNNLGVYSGSGSWDINVPFFGSYDGSIATAIEFGSASAGVTAQWVANWTNAGYDYNTYSYAWNATWATGGTGVVRMKLNPNGGTQQIFIVPIDTSFQDWQITPTDQVPALQGVFTLPVTLTPYIPTTTLGGSGNWC